jgi:hypothetical protein
MEDEQYIYWEFSKYLAVCTAVQYEKGTALRIRNPLKGIWQRCEGHHWGTLLCGNKTRTSELVSKGKIILYTSSFIQVYKHCNKRLQTRLCLQVVITHTDWKSRSSQIIWSAISAPPHCRGTGIDPLGLEAALGAWCVFS